MYLTLVLHYSGKNTESQGFRGSPMAGSSFHYDKCNAKKLSEGTRGADKIFSTLVRLSSLAD